MPRLPRYVLPGHPQHVIQRGNNRCPIFIADEDYTGFRQQLMEACRRYRCIMHAYVFMTNHVHRVMPPERQDSIAKVFQSVGRRYVQYFNFNYQRAGTLWQGHCKATVIDSQCYLLTCCRYTVKPVQANRAAHPARYRWSSYRANALSHHDAPLTPLAGIWHWEITPHSDRRHFEHCLTPTSMP